MRIVLSGSVKLGFLSVIKFYLVALYKTDAHSYRYGLVKLFIYDSNTSSHFIEMNV